MAKNTITARQRNFVLDTMRLAANNKRAELNKLRDGLLPKLSDEEIIQRLTKAGFEVDPRDMYYPRRLKPVPSAAVAKKVSEVDKRIEEVDKAVKAAQILMELGGAEDLIESLNNFNATMEKI